MAASDADEVLSGSRVADLVQGNALAKVRGAHLPVGVGKGAFVLGTDTLVSLGRRVMGKPGSADEAKEMVNALSGRRHQVVSGVALARLGGPSIEAEGTQIRTACTSTQVVFAKLDEPQMVAYVEGGEWRGKAGGYAVQGQAALFVRGVKGEYSNVVGLPLHLLYGVFATLGFDLVRREWL